MKGIYNGIECRTGDQRIDGVWQKALIYDCKPEGDDENALSEAGFEDLDNGLWVKVITKQQHREMIKEFERQRQITEQEKLVQNHNENEERIKLETQLHMYNERMASRRAKMRWLKIEFEGASVFALVISLIFVFVSALYRSDPTMKTIALPLWASLSLLPVIMIASFIAAIRKQPEIYLVLAVLLIITAVIAWDMASIVVALAACAFIAFYIITRSVSELKKEPEYPHYFNKTFDEFIR